jgi:hypothetical protein
LEPAPATVGMLSSSKALACRLTADVQPSQPEIPTIAAFPFLAISFHNSGSSWL